MGILPSFSHVITTTTWLNHLHFNEMMKEKFEWEQYKDAACCFIQILEVVTHQTAGVQLLTPHLTNDPNKICWRCKNELISDIFSWTPTNGHTSIGRPVGDL